MNDIPLSDAAYDCLMETLRTYRTGGDMDAPERTPLKREQAERVWIANECKYPHEDACPCMCVCSGTQARTHGTA